MTTTRKMKSGLERDFAKLHPTAQYEPVRLSYTVRHTYTPDFKIAENTFVECKGLFTAADRAKHLHVKKQHPEVKIIFVFQNPHLRLSKLSKTTYAEWCEQHGFEWIAAQSLTNNTVITILNNKEQKLL